MGDLGGSTVTAEDRDVVFDRPRYEVIGGSAHQPPVLQGGIGVEVLQDGVAFGEEAVPVGQPFDGELNPRQPEVVFIEPVDGGALHATSQVQHELIDGDGLLGRNDR